MGQLESCTDDGDKPCLRAGSSTVRSPLIYGWVPVRLILVARADRAALHDGDHARLEKLY